MLDNIKTFRFYCQKILPLVYDDSLSYIETLCKVSSKLNEVIDDYNELIDYYNTLPQLLEQITAKLSELDDFVDTINREFAELDARLTAKVDEKLAKVDEELAKSLELIEHEMAELEAKVNVEIERLRSELTQVINSQLAVFRTELELSENNTKAWTEARLNEFLAELPDVQNVLVYNMITGKLEPVQDVIASMYDVMRDGLTAYEYDRLRLTASEYDNWIVNSIPRGLKAVEYDVHGRKYLYKEPKDYMNHPISGNIVENKMVIDFNTSLLKQSGSYSASEYDNVGITANNYDVLQLTAYEYDWFSNRKVTA